MGARPLVVLSTIVFVVVALIAGPSAAGPPTDDGYVPPVSAPVTDPFRLPRSFVGAGNRGLEYGTTPGQTVTAAGTGVVVFAGPVAGRLVVSVDHHDGLRTTYTGLASVDVERGQAVVKGEPMGTATRRLHFGVRAGLGYLDPIKLFDASSTRARLVPVLGGRVR